MDVNRVLESTLSPDTSTRHNAEQQLSQAADANFATYLTTLAQELANEGAQTHIRQAAGVALKNTLTARDYGRLRHIQQRWREIDPSIRDGVKSLALSALSSKDSRAGQSAAQFVSAIAAADLPKNDWPDLMPSLVLNVGEGSDQLKQSSLAAIGFITESDDVDLRESLVQHSNAILTAVVQGARKEEPNADVRNAAIEALSNAIDFVRTNFENEGERNYIMQVICEATQSGDNRIQAGAYACLNRIMGIYYDKMRFYMEKALFGLTIMGMKSQEEDVAKLAVEFWCTVCEEELSIEDDNELARQEGSSDSRPLFNFARIASREVIPVLLELLAQQDEDAGDEDYNVSRAAYQCLQLFAQTIAGDIVSLVLAFVEHHLRSEDWHYRDAAVSAFGAIMEGPEEKLLDPLVKQALPVLISTMEDSVVQVKDSAAYALGRICESVSDSIDPEAHLPPLIVALFTGLSSNPKMANSCCWALMNLADRFAGEPGCQENPLSPQYKTSIDHLLGVTEISQTDNQLRMAAYEVLNVFVSNSANDCLPVVASLSEVILKRLQDTVPMQQQIVSVDDKNTLEEIQTSLTTVLCSIIQRLEREIQPKADLIMQTLLQILNSVGPKSSVPDSIFGAIGALSTAMEEEFNKYMDAFAPYLYNALGNTEEIGLCAMAIGLVSDIARSIGELVHPYCDNFMNYLLSNLQNSSFNSQLRPAILQCFGDVAQAIGGNFEKYLGTVAQVLDAAANVTRQEVGFDMMDYVVSLSEGIMDAWGGIILALKQGKAETLKPYVEPIFSYLSQIAQTQTRSEALLRATMGVIGDLADTFPQGEFANYFQSNWVLGLIKEVRTSRDYQPRTLETARWAREQVKRQPANANAQMS